MFATAFPILFSAGVAGLTTYISKTADYMGWWWWITVR
jgi:hypothetical protein